MTPVGLQPNNTNLRVGDLVEVRSESEILATLDEHGRLDGLPFMPEMLRFCGKRFQVQSRAHKTCDTGRAAGFRRLENAVHLKELRCDGSSHGGCQASCLLFWKEDWLRSVATSSPGEGDQLPAGHLDGAVSPAGRCTPDALEAATRGPTTDNGEETYSCQATELWAATSLLRWWEVRQYAEDLESGNVSFPRLVRGLLVVLLNKFQAANRRYLPRLTLIREGRPYPFVAGTLEGKTPTGRPLNLQPGDWVRIKPKEEIEKTLNADNRNRGLLFDGVMSKYCGRTARVRSRVDKIINERTGTMTHLANECIMLEDVVCTGDYMQLCPRRIYDYWRENWLERL
jgi:hypothetical protein